MVQYKKRQLFKATKMSSQPGVHLCDIRKRVPRPLHPLNVLFLKQRVDRLQGTHVSSNTVRNSSRLPS